MTSPSTALERNDIRLYRQLDAILRDQIAGGQLSPGSRCPPEVQLCLQYGVSRATVRQALAALERDGLIERTAGRGTFVRERAPATMAHARRLRLPWRDFAAKQAARRGTELNFASAVPPAIVAEALKLGPDTATPFFIRVLTDAAGPRAGLKRYVRPDLARHLGSRRRSAPDFPASLAKAAGGSLSCANVWAEAILAEPRFAMILKVPLGAPVLSLWWVETIGGEPAVCSQMLQPGLNVAVDLSEPPQR